MSNIIIHEQQEQCLKQKSIQTIGPLQKAPQFMAFNQNIKHGYRLNYKQPLQMFKSLFILHNQTINIWTHLIGAIVVFSFIVWCFVTVDKAELQYDLKKYQQNVNQGFKQFYFVLQKLEHTMKNYQVQNTIPQSREYSPKIQNQLKEQLNQIRSFIKAQIQNIHLILQQQIKLTDGQKILRLVILQELKQFQTIQDQLISSIQPILHSQITQSIGQKASNIYKLRVKVQQLSQQLNRHIINYLTLQKQSPNPYGIPRWPVLIFLCTATFCLGFSATFHLFFSMSSTAFTYFRRLDYAGIILNIVGTGIAPIYYSLYCNLVMAKIYLTIMILFGMGLFFALLGNWIHRNQNKHWKPIMFGAFGLTYLVPYAHFMLAETIFGNYGDMYKFSESNFWWCFSSFSYLFGLYIFIKKWPQSKFPQKFDFIGSSHQIWHTLCLVGVVTTYIAISINYQTRKKCPCP